MDRLVHLAQEQLTNGTAARAARVKNVTNGVFVSHHHISREFTEFYILQSLGYYDVTLFPNC
jgi:hypothetical protein